MLNSFTPAQMAEWFAGLPADHHFAVGGQRAGVTHDRQPDAEGNVAIRFPDGVRRVPLAEVRFWSSDQPYPGGKRRRR